MTLGDTSSNKNPYDEDSTISRLCLIRAACAHDIYGRRERLYSPLDAVVVIGRGDDGLSSREGVSRLSIQDPRASSQHVRLTASAQGFHLQDLGSKNGTYLNGGRVSEGLLAPGGVLELGQTFFVCSLLPVGFQPSPASLEVQLGPTRSVDPRVILAMEQARKISRTQVSVLILGESGTGKELLAKEIHERSGRKGRLVAVHCGAIPESLLEGELFGYKKGAFTGAERHHEGLIASAEGGTLFLDEIGELSASVQVKLLRVLQEHEVLSIGETRPRKVDVRLICATNRELRVMAFANQFRGDLYARIDGARFTLPPLRERRGDLGILLSHFIEKFAGERAGQCAPSLSTLRLLFNYSWPFNIRELEKVIEVAVALSEGERPINASDLPGELQEPAPSQPASPSPEQVLKAQLIEALKASGGNITAAARAMGKSRMQVHRWLKRFDMKASDED